MEARPPELIDALVRRLVPPDCREHIIGDLWERYTSPRQYLLDAVRTIPAVLASQIRRTARLSLLTIQGVVLAVCYSPGPRATWWHVAAPTLAGVVVSMLRDAYRNRQDGALRRAAIDSTAAVATTLLVQASIGVWQPGVLGLRAVLTGTAFSLLTLTLLRLQWSGVGVRPTVVSPRMSREALFREIRHYERVTRRSSRIEMVGGLLAAAFLGVVAWLVPDPIMRLGCVSGMLGACYVAWSITSATRNRVPDDLDFSRSLAQYREELEHHRQVLTSLWRWYLLPLAAGPAVIALVMIRDAIALGRPLNGIAIFTGTMLLVGCCTAQVGRSSATQLRQRIDALASVQEIPQ
jgi:hypothetical protein